MYEGQNEFHSLNDDCFTIPQLDGMDSPLSGLDSPVSCFSPHPPPILTNPGSSNHPPLIRTKQVSHTLDRNKQVRKLLHDTSNKDCEIEINNKNENVTVTCNAGFYIKVAVPAIHSLATGSVKSYQGVSIHCQDIVGNFDATMAHQNTVVFFRLLSHEKSSLGSVRIHLHHTVRKVQLQGGATMPDKTTAPVWFLNQVLNEQFTNISRDKHVDISSFNQAIRGILTGHLNNKQTSNICAGCNNQFNRRSSPEYCSECRLSFHKYKCFPTNSHACYRRRTAHTGSTSLEQTNQATVQTPGSAGLSELPQPVQQLCRTVQPLSIQSNEAAGPPINSDNSKDPCDYDQSNGLLSVMSPPSNIITPTHVPTGCHGVPVLPILQPRPPSQGTDGPALSDRENTYHTQASTSQDQSFQLAVRDDSSNLNPNASPFESQVNFGNTVNQAAGPAQHKGRGKGKRNAASTDLEKTELEFVKLEVSTLKARLQKQENELKDLRFKNSLLLARNKSLEELKEQEIYEKYFPPQPQSNQSTNSSSTAQTCGQNNTHHCCIQPPLPCRPPGCTYHHICPGNHTGHDSIDNIGMVNKKLEDLSRALQKHQQYLDALLKTSVTTNTVISDATSLPPSPPIPEATTTVPATPTASTVQADNSTISLDGFMFGEDENEMDLN